MPKRKSLAEELAELANPAPTKEIDPEADIFGSGPVLEASDEEIVEHKKPRGRERPRLRADIAIEDKAYSGKRSSRKDFFNEDIAEVEGDDDGSDVDSDLEGEEEYASSESDEGEDVHGSEGEDEDTQNEEGSDVDEEAESDEEEDEDEAAALEREYRAVQAEEAHAMVGLQERAAKEKKKAVAVKAQKSLWNAGLELRIVLQRALQGGNKLPQPEGHRAVFATDKDLAKGLEGLAGDARGALGDFLGLLEALEEQNHASKQAQEAAGMGKRKAHANGNGAAASVDALWSELDSSYARFAPFRDASIDRWHRKTVLTTGSAARGNLKALNQSISSQVALLMKDADRVVHRARLPKRQRTILCEVEGERGVSGLAEDGEDDLIQPDEERDPETYDDSEFYQTLLKEFLEEKRDSSGVTWYTGPKQRKLVDRRASKGRKLRYHIHEKLVNFMAPVDLEAPVYASNVFANLFGGATHKV